MLKIATATEVGAQAAEVSVLLSFVPFQVLKWMKQHSREIISMSETFFEMSAETVALPVIRNTYLRAHTAGRSNRENVTAL